MSSQIAYLGPPREHAAGPAGTRAPDVRIAATALLGLGAIGVWWPALGAWALWGLPAVALATAMVAGLVPTRGPSFLGRAALTVAVVGWPMLVALLAFGTLGPLHSAALANGLQALLLEARLRTSEPGALVVWLYVTAVAWTVGADLATRPGRASAAAAFFALAAPMGLALGLQGNAGGAAWHGGLVIATALLWATRGNLRGTLPFVAGVAVVAIVVAAAFGPKSRWDALNQPRDGRGSTRAGQTPRSTSGGSALNTNQTYGPITSDFTGADMFTIRAPRPALWRMETLDVFDGRAWVAGSRQGDELPQPAGSSETTEVKIQGLTDRRVMSPGRVVSVSGAGNTNGGAGESVALPSSPSSGDTYTVTSTPVAPTLDQLARVRTPTGDAYTPYTTVFQGRSDIPTPASSVVPRMSPQFAASDWGKVFRLSYDLSQASSELAVVRNVQNYLTVGGTFQYTLNAAPAGGDPLIDFLVNDRRGYCQHFAGAAALLLRLAGIPTRVAVGFATGLDTGAGSYEVRDEDAHAWIEVYFPGYGWVPFNPTPAGADARIAPGVDVLSPSGSGNTGGSGADRASSSTPKYVAFGVIVLAALLVAGRWWRRRRMLPTPPLGDVLARLAPPPAGPTTTHRELREALARVGPATAALAEEAERQRFAGPGTPPEPHPWRRVWRAAIKDFGLFGAVRLMTVGPPRPRLKDAVAARSAGPSVAPAAARAADAASAKAASVAPPGR